MDTLLDRRKYYLLTLPVHALWILFYYFVIGKHIQNTNIYILFLIIPMIIYTIIIDIYLVKSNKKK